MTIPGFLKENDTIGIVSPAGVITEEELAPALQVIGQWGFRTRLGKHVYARENRFAGTDGQRAKDFQEMLDHDEVKAILCTRGGYGTIRMIDKLDFKKFMKHPKWVIGFSDITIFHSYSTSTLNISTVHATMPSKFPRDGSEDKSVKSLKNVITGQWAIYEVESHLLNKQGMAKGMLVGGNLSVLYSLEGTIYDLDTSGKILFIEDVGEHLYHLDRMMTSLRLRGKLKKLKGLIVGSMTDMLNQEPLFGKSAYKIIHDAVKNYEFPVCFGFPAGHDVENLALVMGADIYLQVGKDNTVGKSLFPIL